jgi:hypothetical protein
VRKVSGPLLFLLGLLAVGAVAGATFGIASVAGLGDDDEVVADQPAMDVPTTTVGSTGTTAGGLSPDQVEVTGIATDVTIEEVQHFPALALPLTVTTPERGFGAGARITDVGVDGAQALVTWDAGRPFVLGPGEGSLVPSIVNAYLAPGTCTVGFPDGRAQGLSHGTYSLQTPVAVSHGAGLGEAHDEGVTFETNDLSAVSFTGGASASIPPASLDLVGPGRVVIAGEALTVRHPDGTTTTATSVEVPAGSAFTLHAEPLLGGLWQVTALLQGDLTTAP